MENLDIIIPNKFNIRSGKHKIDLRTETPKFRFVFKAEVSTSTYDIEFPAEPQIEKILQQSESGAYSQQEAKKFQDKFANRVFLIVLLFYLPILFVFLGIFISLSLDPVARQTDAGLGPGLALIFIICIGIFFLPTFKKRILGRK